MKKIISLLVLLLNITHINAATTVNDQNQTKFSVLSLNVALLALLAKVPEVKVSKVKTPVVKVPKKVLGVKVPKKIAEAKVPSLTVPEVKVGGRTVRLREVGHLQENETRAKRITDTIIALDQQGKAPDILLFQEAFDTTVVGSLYNRIKTRYPYHYRDTRAGRVKISGVEAPIGTNSGLALFSKYPIVRTAIKDYSCFAGEGAFARKGLLGAEIMIDGQRVYVFTTHLQAGIGAEPFKWLEKNRWLAKQKDACVIDGAPVEPSSTNQIRFAELQQARKWIYEFATDKTAPIIFGGDFNINPSNQKDIATVFPEATDLYNVEKSAPNTGTVWDMKNKRVEQGKRIDYLMIVRNPGNRLSGDAWIVDWFTHQHTDHLGFFGEFSLAK